ncbi:hypothetical protein MHL40_21990 [Pseudomonas luteola]|uniref:ADP-ribosyltransferase-containing protein n=1 Tax=Pseudomonas luteola TaxID=47886 RepID=UPI001EF520D7|nr:hypothetical protein [Pseudomonas luteola]MCG7375324.1 hypothetical protein [Pseudomonas luteola]
MRKPNQLFPVLRCFHGTAANFTVFHPSERGSFGSGIYAAVDEAAAKEYAAGAFLLTLDMRLQNPYRYSASFEHSVDLDSAAIDLVQTLFSEEQAGALIQAAIATDGYFGEEIQRALKARGYDGIIATYEDGSQEALCFSPEQVTILDRQTITHELSASFNP